jgi:oxygen-dependent protoporphyrinogen oxidase
MGTLVEALEAHLPPGTVRYDSPIDTIDIDAEGIRVAPLGSPDSNSFRLHAEPPLIFAAPAHVAATLFQSIDADAAALCARVPYVSTASVALAWPRRAIAHPLDGTGFVVARTHSDARITACTWVSSKWAERAPTGMALLRAFIGGAHDPGAASLTDDELVTIVRRDLGTVLGITAEPALTRVYRWINAGAQHTVGHLDRVAEIERRLAPHGIFVAGSGFRSVGIPDCIADARRVAADAAAHVRALTSRPDLRPSREALRRDSP